MSAFKLVKLATPAVNIINIKDSLIPRGYFNESTTYDIGDIVTYEDVAYLMFNTAPAGTLPTSQDFFQRLV